MNIQSQERRLAKLEEQKGASVPFVICDADRDFMLEHGRLMTEAEMDAYEARIRADGTVAPGQQVFRVQHVIVAPPDYEGRA